jgi:hypothetical protein
MKCKSPGTAKMIARKSPKGFQKQMEKQREAHKLGVELKKTALKQHRAKLEVV